MQAVGHVATSRSSTASSASTARVSIWRRPTPSAGSCPYCARRARAGGDLAVRPQVPEAQAGRPISAPWRSTTRRWRSIRTRSKRTWQPGLERDYRSISLPRRDRRHRVHPRRAAKDLPEPEPVSPFQHLDERKAAIYENLRDLQFEYRVGKLSDADYQHDQAGPAEGTGRACWRRSTSCKRHRRRMHGAGPARQQPPKPRPQGRRPSSAPLQRDVRQSPEILRRVRQADEGGAA